MRVYIYIFFFRSFPLYYKILNIVPCAIVPLLFIYFIYGSVYLIIPDSSFKPHPPFSFSNHKFVLFVCEAITQSFEPQFSHL